MKSMIKKVVVLLLTLSVLLVPFSVSALAEESKGVIVQPIEIGTNSASFSISCEGVTKFAIIVTNRDNQNKTIFNGPAIDRTQANISDLLPGTNYTIYVQAYIQGEKYLEEVASGMYSFTTATVNNTAASITVTPQEGAGYVKLNWNQITDNKGVLGYYVYRSTSSGNYGNIPETDFWINGTTYTDIKVQANTTYYYIVKPVYGDRSIGAASSEVSAIPKAGGTTLVLTIDNPKMKVNGIEKEIDPGKGTVPVIKDGRTCLPIRAVAEEMGCTVGYEPKDSRVTIVKELGNDKKTVEFWVGKTTFKVNGIAHTMDVAPYVSATGRTMIPLRYVGDYLDAAMNWDGITKTVTLVFEKGNAISTEAPGTIEGPTTPTTPTTSANAPTAYQVPHELNWNGVWDTHNGSMVLVQTQDRVEGFYGIHGGFIYKIVDARVENDQLVGTFKEGTHTGTFTFTLSTDSEGIISFIGEYKYTGSNEENYWDGQKISDDFGTVGTEWGGVWVTHYGPMVLYQVGSHITGIYMSSGYLYQFSGNITGNTFAGRFDEGDDYKGDFKFLMTKAGRVIFNGQWKYDYDEEWREWDGFKAK